LNEHALFSPQPGETALPRFRRRLQGASRFLVRGRLEYLRQPGKQGSARFLCCVLFGIVHVRAARNSKHRRFIQEFAAAAS
jgi:hypothetical protein